MYNSGHYIYDQFRKAVVQTRAEPTSQNTAFLVDMMALIPLREYTKFEEAISANTHDYREYQSKRQIIPWVDCLHANGYRRESALAQIREIPNAFCALVLIRRLNDWVPQVRETASKVLLKISAKTEGPLIGEALWYVAPNFLRWGRIQPSDISLIRDLIGRSDVISHIISMFIGEQSGRLPSKYGALFRNSDIGPYLPSLASKAPHPGIRALAYRSMLEGRFRWVSGQKSEWIDKSLGKKHFVAVYDEIKLDTGLFDIENLIHKAATDRSVMVRRTAGDALVARVSSPTSGMDKVARLLKADSYPSVSERADYYLRNRSAL